MFIAMRELPSAFHCQAIAGGCHRQLGYLRTELAPHGRHQLAGSIAGARWLQKWLSYYFTKELGRYPLGIGKDKLTAILPAMRVLSQKFVSLA